MGGLEWVATWCCLGLGALFGLHGLVLLVMGRTGLPRSRPRGRLEYLQPLGLGAALVLMGLGNLLSGWWRALAFVGMVLLGLSAVRDFRTRRRHP